MRTTQRARTSASRDGWAFSAVQKNAKSNVMAERRSNSLIQDYKIYRINMILVLVAQ